jgi:hypothetical protein
MNKPFCANYMIMPYTDNDKDGNPIKVIYIESRADIYMADKGIYAGYIFDERTIRLVKPCMGYGMTWGGNPQRKKRYIHLCFPEGTRFWYKHFCQFDGANRAVLKTNITGAIAPYTLSVNGPFMISAIVYWQVALVEPQTKEKMEEFMKEMTNLKGLDRVFEGKLPQFDVHC